MSYCLWGSEIRFRVPCGQLGGDVVLVGEPAEYVLPADPVLGEVDRFWWAGAGFSWGELAEGARRPGRVVVPQALGQHLAHVQLVVDQPVQGLRRGVPMSRPRSCRSLGGQGSARRWRPRTGGRA